MNNKTFIKLSHSVFIEGYTRSVVCDIQRKVFFIVPKELPSFVKFANGKQINEIYKHYGKTNELVLAEYLNFLESNDLVFFSNDHEDVNRFAELCVEDFFYNQIDNAIIDIDKKTLFPITEIIIQLNELGCKHIQIRFFRETWEKEILDLLNFTKETEIESIEIIAPFTISIQSANFEHIFIENQRFYSIVLYNSPYSALESFYEGIFKITYLEFNCNSALHCGIVHPSYFQTNIPFYIESLKFNNCLNRKISIDSIGNIKNCPSMQKIHGNVLDSDLSTVLNTSDFKDLWHINKDKVHVCKDCEFRYVCTDCRAFLQEPEDSCSKPLKCGYNPYVGKWENWTENPLSQKGIEFYKLNAII